jgi:hypothetical protein
MYFKPYHIERPLNFFANVRLELLGREGGVGGEGFNFVMCEQVRCLSNINMGMHIGKAIFKTSIGQALTNR